MGSSAINGRERTARCRPGRGRCLWLCLGLFCAAIAGGTSQAQSFLERTALVDVHAGSSHEATISALASGGYELADATPIRFDHWYSSRWSDLGVTWVTEVNRDLGITWGLRSGERGEKYHVQPALKLGFIVIDQLSPRSTLSFSASGLVGGWLKEGTCRADYGEIGGVQRVNCRLAASPLPPAETLKYLLRVPPPDRLILSLRYTFQF